MKILFSCLSRSWGGMEMYTLTQLLELKKNNIEVDLLCFPSSNLHNEAKQHSINTYCIKAKSYFHPFKIFQVKKIIEENKYDAIHTHASKDLWILTPALNLVEWDIPLFFTKHVGSFIVKKDLFHNYIYSRITKTFAISKIIKKNLIDTCPIDVSKIDILYDGIDTQKFKVNPKSTQKIRKEFEIGTNEIVIGITGRFSPGKGHLDFISAVEILNKKYSNLKFLIVGEATHSEDDYANRVISFGKHFNNIIFTGYRKDIPDILSAMDIFVFPSHAEAFGMALVEAMAVELPSVATNSDGVLDIIDDNVNGLFFENKNVTDLADKISMLINDELLRVRLGKSAREKVINNFEMNSITTQLIRHYHNFLSKEL